MTPATVYVVDDDSSVRDALAWLLRSRRLMSELFDSAESFDEVVSSPDFVIREPSCVLLDMRMGGMSGLVMFEKLIACGLLPLLPVIFLTGHADVPTAVVMNEAIELAKRFSTEDSGRFVNGILSALLDSVRPNSK